MASQSHHAKRVPKVWERSLDEEKEGEVMTESMDLVRWDIKTEAWFTRLIDDCRNIIVETEFTARWALIEGYHQLGKRILEENDNFERAKIYNEKILQRIAESLGKSERTLYYAVQFARKYPDLNLLPAGKNVSWHQICNKYLPEAKEAGFLLLPEGIYDVIYADPPWRYDFDIDSRATENHYPTLLVKDICGLTDYNTVRIQDKFAENAMLYLWATAPKLNEALEVIEAWGFTYKTNMVWVKDKIGLGWYCRNQHELLLIAERGEMPLPEPVVRPASVMSYLRTTHSTKPLEMYAEIERWYPGRQYLEVFGVSNEARPKHWAVFGNMEYHE